ncbi:MAG: hypothetical protein SNF33_00080 (plasmid) [Candidatus Algichlamydia australiensis]|nr:hypothetical protein [Chlamydiales bacterium]
MSGKASLESRPSQWEIVDFSLQFQDPVTREVFVDPVVTRCGHLFSEKVLVNWFKSHHPLARAVPCPLCRERVVKDEWTSVPVFNELLDQIQKHGYEFVSRRDVEAEISTSENAPSDRNQVIERACSKKPTPLASDHSSTDAAPPTETSPSSPASYESKLVKIDAHTYEIHTQGKKIPFGSKLLPSSVVRMRAEAFKKHLESSPEIMRAYEKIMEDGGHFCYSPGEGISIPTIDYGIGGKAHYRQVTFEKPVPSAIYPSSSDAAPPTETSPSSPTSYESKLVKIDAHTYEIHTQGKKIPFGNKRLPSSVVRMRAEAFKKHLESSPEVMRIFEEIMEDDGHFCYSPGEGISVPTIDYGIGGKAHYRQVTFEKPPEQPKPVIQRAPARTTTRHRRDNSDSCILI